MTILAPDPSDHQALGRRPFFWVVLLLGTVILGLYVFAGVMVFRYGNLTKDFGWQAIRTGESWYISEVDPLGAATGKLQVGDQLVAINNENRISRIGPDIKRRAIQADSSYTIRVMRGTSEHQFDLQVLLKRDSRRIGIIISLLVMGLAFYILALFIGILKPHQRVVQLASLAAFALAVTNLRSLAPLRDFFQRPELITYTLINLFYPVYLPLAYHFYYRFPPGAPRGRLWSFLLILIYISAAMAAITLRYMDLVSLQGEQPELAFFFDNSQFLDVFSKFYSVFEVLVPISMFAVSIRNYRLIKRPDQRRRIKWILYGSAIPILFLGLGDLLRHILEAAGYGYFTTTYGFYVIEQLRNLTAVIIPITLGYAIIVHRLFDISIIIRRGVQYLLAKNVLRVIISLPVLGLTYTILSNPNRTLAEILFRNSIYFYVLLIAAFVLSFKFRRRLREWVDRKFFREAYDQEKILLKLTDEVKRLDSISDISKLVSDEVNSALHPERVYLFYRDEEKRDLALGYSSDGRSPNLRISGGFQLLHLIEAQGSTQDFPFPLINALPRNECEWLEGLKANLVVPMSGTDGRLAGIILLGEKRSEEPYTPNDRKLLTALGGQIAIVYENLWLKGQVNRSQKIQREVLARFEEQKINLVKECPQCGACFDSVAQVCLKDGSALTLSLPVERIIEGQYRLERLIGKGGMGAVYQATDLRLDRKVAIKIMLGSMFGDQIALRRFEREARASARLNHPNIIAVYDYGGIRDEGAYLVMELVHGSNLRSEIQRAGNLLPQIAAEWFEQILEGVQMAHQNGIIHRDLKPENILVSRQEDGHTHIKILDFGLAKISSTELTSMSSLTTPGNTLGTVAYMSPEQLAGEEVDERSDIFTLGVMAVECLTGQRPFYGRTLTEQVMSIQRDPFHLPGDSAGVRRLNEVLDKCLAKDRAARYASITEMQKELIPAMRDCPPFAAVRSLYSNADTVEVKTLPGGATLRDAGPGGNVQETVIDHSAFTFSSEDEED